MLKNKFKKIEIIEDIRQGKMVILTDAPDRENEGDFVMAAEAVTPQAVNFMITHGRGLVCMPLSAVCARRLGLTMMSSHNQSRYQTQFTVSIEAKEGVTTGISAFDRARTIQVAASAMSTADDIVTPGHVFPIQAHDGGVLARPGHTEAAVQLAMLAGFEAVAVVCEILNADGTMARVPDLEKIKNQHHLKMGTISDLITYLKKGVA